MKISAVWTHLCLSDIIGIHYPDFGITITRRRENHLSSIWRKISICIVARCGGQRQYSIPKTIHLERSLLLHRMYEIDIWRLKLPHTSKSIGIWCEMATEGRVFVLMSDDVRCNTRCWASYNCSLILCCLYATNSKRMCCSKKFFRQSKSNTLKICLGF